MAALAAKAMAKPGLGALLADVGVSLLSPELGVAAAAATAAVALPGISLLPTALADAAAPTFGAGVRERFGGRGTSYTPVLPEGVVAPKAFGTLLDPVQFAIIFAKNISLHLLIKFNMYMLALNEYESARMTAEEQGTLPPEPPPVPDQQQIVDTVTSGVYSGLREYGTRVVRLAYEHVLTHRLGLSKAQPFLRNGALYVTRTLAVRHQSAGVAKRVFHYTFAMLHASALFYAAECTVAIAQNAYAAWCTDRNKGKRTSAKVWLTANGVVYHLGRCTVLLCATSLAASVGTIAKPGLGTKAFPLITDVAINHSLHPLARAYLA